MVSLERRIKERFNELSKDFPSEISLKDSRLKAVLDFFGDVQNKLILDVGCGKGRFAKQLIKKGAKVAGIDPAEKFVEEANKIKGGSFKIGSATNIPFSDSTFDCIICIEVIEHIPKTEKAIREMLRVLKRTGKIIIIDKNIFSFDFTARFPFFSIVIKKYREIRNRWMYPYDFPFKEKWFNPWGVKRMLGKYCSRVELQFLPQRIFKNKIENVINLNFPFLNYFVGWKGVK